MTIVNIQDYVDSKIAKKIELEVIQYNINTSAVIYVNFLNDKNEKTSSILVYIEEDDFNINWTTDNQLIDIVLRKLGLSLKVRLLGLSQVVSQENKTRNYRTKRRTTH